jgi:F-type H+-transporting ATPase subunit b
MIGVAMSRKGKRLLKLIGFLYLAAVGLLIYTIPYGRARRTCPELIWSRETVPQPPASAYEEGDEAHRAAREKLLKAYKAAREEFLKAGYVLRADEGGLKRGAVIGEEELYHLLESGVPSVNVGDPRLCRDLAAQKLKAGEEVRGPGGMPLLRFDDDLTEGKLIELALAEDGKPAGERLEQIWVRGTGSIIGFDLTLVFTGLNFLALVALLYAFLWDPIARVLDDRAKAIREDIETARGERDEAESLRSEAESRLADIRRDAHRMVEEGRAEGEEEKSRIVAEGREEARRLAERTERAMQAEAEGARKRLVSEIAGLSVDLAGKMLGREVTSADHERLVNKFVRSLEADAARGDGGAG